jgi:hypothetical protein
MIHNIEYSGIKFLEKKKEALIDQESNIFL